MDVKVTRLDTLSSHGLIRALARGMGGIRPVIQAAQEGRLHVPLSPASREQLARAQVKRDRKAARNREQAQRGAGR